MTIYFPQIVTIKHVVIDSSDIIHRSQDVIVSKIRSIVHPVYSFCFLESRMDKFRRRRGFFQPDVPSARPSDDQKTDIWFLTINYEQQAATETFCFLSQEAADLAHLQLLEAIAMLKSSKKDSII